VGRHRDCLCVLTNILNLYNQDSAGLGSGQGDPSLISAATKKAINFPTGNMLGPPYTSSPMPGDILRSPSGIESGCPFGHQFLDGLELMSPADTSSNEDHFSDAPEGNDQEDTIVLGTSKTTPYNTTHGSTPQNDTSQQSIEKAATPHTASGKSNINAIPGAFGDDGVEDEYSEAVEAPIIDGSTSIAPAGLAAAADYNTKRGAPPEIAVKWNQKTDIIQPKVKEERERIERLVGQERSRSQSPSASPVSGRSSTLDSKTSSQDNCLNPDKPVSPIRTATAEASGPREGIHAAPVPPMGDSKSGSISRASDSASSLVRAPEGVHDGQDERLGEDVAEKKPDVKNDEVEVVKDDAAADFTKEESPGGFGGDDFDDFGEAVEADDFNTFDDFEGFQDGQIDDDFEEAEPVAPVSFLPKLPVPLPDFENHSGVGDVLVNAVEMMFTMEGIERRKPSSMEGRSFLTERR
jgi:hypothetical protein